VVAREELLFRVRTKRRGVPEFLARPWGFLYPAVQFEPTFFPDDRLHSLCR